METKIIFRAKPMRVLCGGAEREKILIPNVLTKRHTVATANAWRNGPRADFWMYNSVFFEKLLNTEFDKLFRRRWVYLDEIPEYMTVSATGFLRTVEVVMP